MNPQTGIALLVTVARAYQAAITMIENTTPSQVSFLTTEQFRHNVPIILEHVSLPNPPRIHLTVHNNIHQTYADALEALEALQALKPTALHVDVTSCTTPMSIAIWEASKRVGAVVHWIDKTEHGSLIHRLSLPEEE